MRISGNILDRILNIILPICAIYYFGSFIIPEKVLNYPTNLQRFCLCFFMFCLGTAGELFNFYYRKIKILKVGDQLIFSGKSMSDKDIQSIKFVRGGKFFDMIKFEIKNAGEIKNILIMDKAKFLGLFGPKGSRTLNYLYYYFPELQEKEIKESS